MAPKIHRFISPLFLLACGAALAGCVTGGEKKAEDPLAEEASAVATPKPSAPPPAAIQTVKDWDSLDNDVRRDLLDGEYKRYKNITLTAAQPVAHVTDAAQHAFVDKMAAYMRTNGDMNIEDASHAKVGPLEESVELLLLDGKTLLGGRIHFRQIGCDMPDESAPAFKSAKEAETAGCEMGAGVWRADGSFNHSGTPIEYGDYMEWVAP